LLLVLLFPQGIAGFAKQLSERVMRGRRREVDVALKEKRT